MPHSREEARLLLQDAFKSVEEDYRRRGIFQDRFGFGRSPAVVVVDFAYGWTDDAYAGGSQLLDGPIEATRSLLDAARAASLPIIYTTSPWRPHSGDQPFKSAADLSPGFRAWDERACRIDERVAPHPGDLVLEKENASAFFGTHLVSYLIGHGVDTLLIAGCSTSACIRATATDAKSHRFSSGHHPRMRRGPFARRSRVDPVRYSSSVRRRRAVGRSPCLHTELGRTVDDRESATTLGATRPFVPNQWYNLIVKPQILLPSTQRDRFPDALPGLPARGDAILIKERVDFVPEPPERDAFLLGRLGELRLVADVLRFRTPEASGAL